MPLIARRSCRLSKLLNRYRRPDDAPGEDGTPSSPDGRHHHDVITDDVAVAFVAAVMHAAGSRVAVLAGGDRRFDCAFQKNNGGAAPYRSKSARALPAQAIQARCRRTASGVPSPGEALGPGGIRKARNGDHNHDDHSPPPPTSGTVPLGDSSRRDPGKKSLRVGAARRRTTRGSSSRRPRVIGRCGRWGRSFGNAGWPGRRCAREPAALTHQPPQPSVQP